MHAQAPRRWGLPMTAAGALAAALAAFGVWALRRFDPNTASNPFLPCLFREATGLYCPGCGTTRALHALVHGDIAGVFAMNPLLPFVMIALPLLAWVNAGRTLPGPPRLVRPLAVTLTSAKFWLVLMLGYWIARNLPWWPFAWLAPG